jgi:hypothetical protein
MGLKKHDFKIVRRYLSIIFGHILLDDDVKHLICQMKHDLMILKAPKREMKTWGFK